MGTFEFDQMLSGNSRFLKGFAYAFTRNMDDAEDLIQDTLLKALRYKEHFTEGTNFRGWLYTIMRNIFINGYKRKKLQQTIHDSTPNQYYVNLGKVSEDLVSHRINEKDIHLSIGRLSYDFRAPFLMFIDGYHYNEIANAMAIPLGTVKSRIYHARKKLMDELKSFR